MDIFEKFSRFSDLEINGEVNRVGLGQIIEYRQISPDFLLMNSPAVGHQWHLARVLLSRGPGAAALVEPVGHLSDQSFGNCASKSLVMPRRRSGRSRQYVNLATAACHQRRMQDVTAVGAGEQGAKPQVGSIRGTG